MSEKGIEYKVGLLIVAAIGIAATLIIVLGSFSFESGYTINVDYNFSGNVKPGAPVKLAGIKVGKVKAVNLMNGEIDQKTGRRILVRLDVWIEERVIESIRQDAEFFINTSGVLGEQYLEIVPGQDYQKPALGKNTVVRGIDPPRTDLIVSRLYSVLDSLSTVLTEDRDAIGNLLTNGASAVHELNIILSENKEEISRLITSTDTLAKQAGITLEKVNQGLDPKVLHRTLKNAETLLNTTDHSIRTLTPKTVNLLNDATRITTMVTDKRVNKVVAVADKAVELGTQTGQLVERVDTIVQTVGKGKGSIGALLVRDELYYDLREMLRDLKKNPWKFFWKE